MGYKRGEHLAVKGHRRPVGLGRPVGHGRGTAEAQTRSKGAVRKTNRAVLSAFWNWRRVRMSSREISSGFDKDNCLTHRVILLQMQFL